MGNTATFTSSFGVRVQVALWLVTFSFVVYLSMVIFGWPEALKRAAPLFACHLINFYAWYSWLMPRYYEKNRYLEAFISLLVLLTVLTAIRIFIEKQFEPMPGVPVVGRFIDARIRNGIALFSGISITVLATLLRLAVSNEKARLKVSELERMQLESELRFLKAQMNPHFLFNAINNIYSLVMTMSPNAPDALLKLSGLLRYLLYECHDKVPLHKEVSALKAYAELYQLKFENPLKLEIDTRMTGRNVPIEPLLLIPLLENACKHSGLGIDPNAYALFTIRQEGDHLIVHTENSKAVAPVSDEQGGIGLANIRKRLQMIYNDRYALVITENDQQFAIELKFPL